MSTETAEAAPWRTSIYGRIGALVLKRPLATLAVTGVVLALLVAGLTPFQTNYDNLASLPKDTESVRSFELLREGFPTGELSPTRVLRFVAARRERARSRVTTARRHDNC